MNALSKTIGSADDKYANFSTKTTAPHRVCENVKYDS